MRDTHHKTNYYKKKSHYLRKNEKNRGTGMCAVRKFLKELTVIGGSEQCLAMRRMQYNTVIDIFGGKRMLVSKNISDFGHQKVDF